jgi:hypothetical protein
MIADPFEEIFSLGPLRLRIQDQTGEIVSIKPAQADLLKSRTGFTHELHKDGIWL